MFLIISNYIVSSDKVEPHRDQHVAWVQQYIDSGDFLIAGPRRGKVGGVIFSRSIDRGKLMQILAEDSFVIEDLVEIQLVDFDAPLTSEALIELRDM